MAQPTMAREDEDMAVQTTVARPAGTLRVGLLGVALIAATAFSAGIGLGASNWLAPVSRIQAITQPAPAFDGPGFRLGEKIALAQPAPLFDAAAFRLQEKLR
jgi:hypothetical protein